MNHYIYILSNSIYVKSDMYKVGKHTGTMSQLISRYRTALIDPKIYLFVSCEKYTYVENEIKYELKTNRIKYDGKLSEWVNLPITELIEIVTNIINRCCNNTVPEIGLNTKIKLRPTDKQRPTVKLNNDP